MAKRYPDVFDQQKFTPTLPSPADATTGGASGTITVTGPGEFLISLPTSGHTDASDGCFAAFRAKDVFGNTLPAYGELSSASDSRGGSPIGWVEVESVSAPTAGNGVRVGVVVVAAPDASSVTSTAAQGYGGCLDFGATPGVRAEFIRSTGWAISSAESNADVALVRASGDFVRHGLATGHSVPGDVARVGRYIGAETLVGSGNSNDPFWVVLYAYRTGASVGTELAAVKVRYALVTNGI